MPKGPENYLIKKIDRKIIKNFLLENSSSSEITDPIEIQKKVNRAVRIFSQFIRTRTNRRNKENISFSMTFDAMRDTLELAHIPGEVAQEAMDEILLSAPGIIKTETGYAVSDPDLLYENFGPGATAKNILEFFSMNPDKTYSYKEIGREFSLSYEAVAMNVKSLIRQGKIIVAEKSKKLDKSLGQSEAKFRIAK